MSAFSKTSMETSIVLRAAAIAAVVFNHAHGPFPVGSFGLSGGMTFLLMMTGYNFARFGFTEAEPPQVRRSLVKLALGIVIPAVFFLIISIPLVGWDWRELLLISNWYPNVGTALFPVEYVALVWQLCLMLWLATWLPGFPITLRYPLITAIVLFCLGVIFRHEFPRYDLIQRLPWLYLWDFSLGMMLFFATKRDNIIDSRILKLGVLASTLVGAYAGWGIYKSSFYWLVAAMIIFLYVPRIPMPKFLGQIMKLGSQATLTVFFTHFLFLHFADGLGIEGHYTRWLFAFGGGIALWIVVTAGRRALEFTWQSRKRTTTKVRSHAPSLEPHALESGKVSNA
jgi:hypothetical protein